MAIVTLLCGGNQGNRRKLLFDALTMLHELGDVLVTSSIYESEPWGFDSENQFLNQAVVVSSPFKPYDVLHMTQAIEKKLGRINKSSKGNYSDRPVDIDILFYDDGIIKDDPKLILPHPHIAKRRFVLEPLNEIIPTYLHPENGKSISRLLRDCPDLMGVKINKQK